MKIMTKVALCLFLWTITVAGDFVTTGFAQETPPSPIVNQSAVNYRATVEEARRQAEVLHTTMHATLHLVHHRLYREDEGLPIPAGVMDEVFKELQNEQNVTLSWLVVEGQAMNTDHKADDQFERDAVDALKRGEVSHEKIEPGLYRRAAAITLTNHCLKCHVPDRKSTEDRKAGLVVSIPVR